MALDDRDYMRAANRENEFGEPIADLPRRRASRQAAPARKPGQPTWLIVLWWLVIGLVAFALMSGMRP